MFMTSKVAKWSDPFMSYPSAVEQYSRRRIIVLALLFPYHIRPQLVKYFDCDIGRLRYEWSSVVGGTSSGIGDDVCVRIYIAMWEERRRQGWWW